MAGDQLCRKGTKAMVEGDLRELVAFTIDAEEFAIDIASVHEINRAVEITRIPNAPEHVQGVINLRGKIVPIVDMRGLLGFEPKEARATSRIIVVEVGGMMLGFLVDAVSEVVRLPQAAVDEPPTFSSGVASSYIDGVGKVDDRLLILLNLRTMFAPSEGSSGFAPD